MKNIISLLISAYLNLLNLLSNKLGGKHAFFLFCYPFKAKISTKQQAFLNSAQLFKLPVRNFEIQCYKWGHGPKNVLMIHGWQSNSYRWRNYIEALDPEQCTIYSIDAPGHGNSGSSIGNVPLYNDALFSIINHIGTLDTIVAHSIGSFSTLYHLKVYPNHKPLKMISLASPGSAQDFVDYYLEELNLSKKTQTNFVTYFEAYAERKISFFSLENLAINNDFPCLIIHDKGDKLVNISHAKNLYAHWSKSNLVITEGFGHKLRDKSITDMVCEFVLRDVEAS